MRLAQSPQQQIQPAPRRQSRRKRTRPERQPGKSRRLAAAQAQRRAPARPAAADGGAGSSAATNETPARRARETCSRQTIALLSATLARVLRNRERNSSTSSAIRAAAPTPVAGLSSVADLIQGSDFCWPQVVGMRKGTGVAAQRHIRAQMPPRKMAHAA